MGRPLGSKNRLQGVGVGRPRGPGRPPGRPPGRGPGRPPGRPRRRYSNSTVASVDLSHVLFVDESVILKPQLTTDDSEWPSFVLQDAIVYRKLKNGRFEQANTCNVDLDGPFIVRGKLEVDVNDVAQVRSLQPDAPKSAYVQIPSSTMYSIGWLEDSEDAVSWSGGKSGWFEIQPAAEYRAMNDTVCEGITLYYFLLDSYTDAQSRAGKSKRDQALLMPVKELLKKYAIRMGDGITFPEAKARCQKHAQFLLAHFHKETELNWKATSFCRWLSEQNPTLCQKLRDAEEARKKPAEPVPTARLSRHQSTSVIPKAESEDDAGLLSRANPAESDRARRTRERATRLSQESDLEMNDAPPIRAPTRIATPIYPPQVPPRPAPASAVAPAPHTPTVARNGQELLDVPEDPIQSFLELLEEILEEVDGDIYKATAGRVHSRMYIKCSTKSYAATPEVSQYYAKELSQRLPAKWHRGPYFEYLLAARSQPWTGMILTEDMVPSQLRRRKSKPRPSRSEPAPTPHMGKRLPATPRTGSLTVKRPRVNYAGDYEDEDNPSKCAKISGDSEEETSEDEQVNDSKGKANGRRYPYSTTPIPPLRGPKETVPLIVRAEKIPTESPTGPNGTWRCEEEGCDFIVRSAEEPDGKLLIDKHFQDHADRAEKVNIALAEGTRGNMPINHLLDRIRKMGEAAPKKRDGANGEFSEAIKRRLIL